MTLLWTVLKSIQSLNHFIQSICHHKLKLRRDELSLTLPLSCISGFQDPLEPFGYPGKYLIDTRSTVVENRLGHTN